MNDADRSAARRETWIFAIACASAGLLFQGARGLWETDEGRYAQCALEMLRSGDFLRPTLQGIPHVTKPPGTYALTAAGIALLGVHEWGARLFLGLAFGLSAWCVRIVGRGLLGDAAGSRAGWCYLAMLYPFAAGSVLTTDTFLACGIVASLACSVTSLRSPHPARWHLAAGLCLGAAMLMKAHIALIPWAAFLVGWRWGGRRAHGGKPAVSAAGIGAGLVVGLAWYAWYCAVTPGAIGYFLGDEVAGRVVSTGDHSSKPFWYYPAILVAGSAPWWVQVVRGIRRLHGGVAASGGVARRAWARVGATDAGRVLACWAGIAAVAFFLSPAKMPLYLLPLAAPIALWAGAGARDESSRTPWAPAWYAVWLAALVGLRAATGLVAEDRDMRALAAQVRDVAPAGTPVRLLAGKDLHGLEFYLGGDFRRVETPEVQTGRNGVDLEAELSALDARGTPWILVTENDRAERRAVQRTLGDRAEVLREVPDPGAPEYRILRIVPKPR